MNSEAESRTWDCIVVGAGPAGLGHDGLNPADLRARGRAELGR